MRPIACIRLLLIALSIGKLSAQNIPEPPTAPGPDKPRVFVTDSNSWETRSGGVSGFGSGGGNIAGGSLGSSSGGARPQTAEIVKTFGQKCPQVTINSHPDASAYVVQLDHEGGKSFLAHKDKVAVFVRDSGDSIFSESTLSVGGSVGDACKAILAHWLAYAPKYAALSATPRPLPTSTVTTIVTQKPRLTVTSTPAGADIELNGNFVGNTPSTIEVEPGNQAVKLTKKGFDAWSRSVKVTGGTITLNADLDSITKP